ncbi:MAG: hypothetical protein EBY21_06690, partial [Alphaproteobacteria bacterium]|nr:hypothetical protein [Alphaproteobacteria bacterium]
MSHAAALNVADYFDAGRIAIQAMMVSSRLSAEDLNLLRRDILKDGLYTAEEIAALFALERQIADKPSEWSNFFVEAVTSYVLWQLRPTGIINEGQAEWLISQVDQIRSPNCLALLVNVVDEAHRVPLWFKTAVASRVRRDLPQNE